MPTKNNNFTTKFEVDPRKGKRQNHLSPSLGTKRIKEISPMDETRPTPFVDVVYGSENEGIASSLLGTPRCTEEGLGNFFMVPPLSHGRCPKHSKAPFLFTQTSNITIGFFLCASLCVCVCVCVFFLNN